MEDSLQSQLETIRKNYFARGKTTNRREKKSIPQRVMSNLLTRNLYNAKKNRKYLKYLMKQWNISSRQRFLKAERKMKGNHEHDRTIYKNIYNLART